VSEALDRSKAKEISAAIEAALQPVAEQFGLELTMKGGTYDINIYRPRIELKTADAGRVDFERYAEMFGLSADDFGREFTTGARRFRISGISPRSTKRPILATEIVSSRVYKFTVEGIKLALGVKAVS